MFIAVLFTIVKMWKQTRADQQVDKELYIQWNITWP